MLVQPFKYLQTVYKKTIQYFEMSEIKKINISTVQHSKNASRTRKTIVQLASKQDNNSVQKCNFKEAQQKTKT